MTVLAAFAAKILIESKNVVVVAHAKNCDLPAKHRTLCCRGFAFSIFALFRPAFNLFCPGCGTASEEKSGNF